MTWQGADGARQGKVPDGPDAGGARQGKGPGGPDAGGTALPSEG